MLTAARKIQRKDVTEHYKDLIKVGLEVATRSSGLSG